MNTTAPVRRGRPPSRTLAVDDDTRTLLLQTGLAVLTEKGYCGVSLDEILAQAQTSKGSFYHQFASKEAFGLALIDAYDAYFVDKLRKHFERSDAAPLQRLRDFADDAQRGMARHDYRRGCLIGNLGQEMGALPESFRSALVRVFSGWQALTARCLQAAVDRGELQRRFDATALAEWFWIGWEGAVLRAKLERRPQALSVFMDGFIAAVRTPE